MAHHDALLEKGSYTNEDRLSVVDRAAWVIDGTSGFSDRSLTDHPDSDGVWFVESIDDYLTDHVDDDAPLEDIVAAAIEHVAAELQREITITPEVSIDPPRVEDAVSIDELPGATLGLVRWDDERLEYYSLGDSSVVVRTAEGVTQHIEGGPQRFDAVLQGQIREYLAEHPDADPATVREAHMPHIRESRQYREIPGGFWSLGVNPFSARQALQGSYALGDVTDVYLFTDGLLDAVEIFELFDDWTALADFIDEHGVERTVERLREVQRRDDTMTTHPRLKPMDDVAVVHLNFPSMDRM